MNFMNVFVIVVFLGIYLIFGVVVYLVGGKYAICKKIKRNLKLIKIKVKTNKIDCLFLDIDNEKEYIIHIRRFLLRKKYIPKKFAIESTPRTNYYNHIKSELKVGKEYNVTFYRSNIDENFILLLEKIE